MIFGNIIFNIQMKHYLMLTFKIEEIYRCRRALNQSVKYCKKRSYLDTENYRLTQLVNLSSKHGVDILCHHSRNQHICTVQLCGQQMCVVTSFSSGKNVLREITPHNNLKTKNMIIFQRIPLNQK